MKPDPERMLSGRPQTTKVPSKAEGEVHASEDLTAWTGGWGQSVASNLTPDPATGLGTRYNEAKFIQTMRTGKKPEGVQLLPPMPTDVYQNMKDDDLKAIYAYFGPSSRFAMRFAPGWRRSRPRARPVVASRPGRRASVMGSPLTGCRATRRIRP